MKHAVAGALFLTAFALGWLSFPSAADEEPRPNLSGTWAVDEKKSEDIEALRAGMPSGERSARTASGRKRGGRRRGRGGRRGDITGGWGASEGRSMPHPVMVASVLEIEHDEPSFLVTFDGRQKRRVFVGGRGASVSASATFPVSTSIADWESDQLFVETSRDVGPRVIERYTLLASRDELEIYISLQHPTLRESVSMTRVFNRISPGEN